MFHFCDGGGQQKILISAKNTHLLKKFIINLANNDGIFFNLCFVEIKNKKDADFKIISFIPSDGFFCFCPSFERLVLNQDGVEFAEFTLNSENDPYCITVSSLSK